MNPSKNRGTFLQPTPILVFRDLLSLKLQRGSCIFLRMERATERRISSDGDTLQTLHRGLTCETHCCSVGSKDLQEVGTTLGIYLANSKFLPFLVHPSHVGGRVLRVPQLNLPFRAGFRPALGALLILTILWIPDHKKISWGVLVPCTPALTSPMPCLSCPVPLHAHSVPLLLHVSPQEQSSR